MQDDRFGEDEAAMNQKMDLNAEIELLERERQQLANDYERKRCEYIRLNNYEGELHGQIADKRGATSNLLVQNKQLEGKILQEQ